MGFISEFRYPTTWYTKLAISVLALAIFALLAAGSISFYMVNRMEAPMRSRSDMNLQNFRPPGQL